ncbi:hypothetical protein AB0M86_47655, partial [Streptomyces sp. NPDC051639]|uniref:hypothetical protein n=1 Tax=Streptomyces sp. NPDC051639 TaxID=3155671 RepID=UPI003418E031
MTKDITFDPDPVFELGNAWITFGDVLDEQMANMAGAQFDLLNAEWMGEAANSMSFAFENNTVQSDGTLAGGGLRPLVAQVVESCWDLGESINYFAMLRAEQAASENKMSLAMVLAAIIGGIFGLFTMFIGEIVGLIGDALETLVSALGTVARAIGSAIGDLVQIVPQLEGLVGDIAEAVAPITAGIADITTGIASVGARAATVIGDGVTGARTALDANAWLRYPAMTTVYGGDFVGSSAATTAVTDGILGTHTDWSHWSPVPTTGEGWEEFLIGGAMMVPIMGAGGVAKAGLGKYKTRSDGAIDVNTPDVTITGTPTVTPPTSVSGRRGGSGGVSSAPGTPLTSSPPRRINSGSSTVKPVVNGPTNSRSVVRTGPGGGTVRTPVDVNDVHTKPTGVQPIRTSSPPVTRAPGRVSAHSAPVADAGAPPARTGAIRGEGWPQVSTPHGVQPPVDRAVPPSRATDERGSVPGGRDGSVPDAVSRPAVRPDDLRSRPVDGTGTTAPGAPLSRPGARDGEPVTAHSPSGAPRQDLTAPRREAGTPADPAASRPAAGVGGGPRRAEPGRGGPVTDRVTAPEGTEGVRTSSGPVTDPASTGMPSRGTVTRGGDALRGGDTTPRAPRDGVPAEASRTSASDAYSRTGSPSPRPGESSGQIRSTTPVGERGPLPGRSEQSGRPAGADGGTRPESIAVRPAGAEDRPAATSRSDAPGTDRRNAEPAARNDRAAGAGRSETPAPGERPTAGTLPANRPATSSAPAGMRRPAGAGDAEPALTAAATGRHPDVHEAATGRTGAQRDGNESAPATRSSVPRRSAEPGAAGESAGRSTVVAGRTTLSPEPATRTSESAARPGTEQDAGSGGTTRHPAPDRPAPPPEAGRD